MSTSIESTETSFDQEQVVMEIIVNAGEARSLCFEALQLARKGKLDDARAKVKLSRDCINQAHLTQTQLIERDQGEGKVPMTLVMVHAQDHLMTTIVVQELAVEMLELHSRVDNQASEQAELKSQLQALSA